MSTAVSLARAEAPLSQNTRIVALDGLRAVSVLLVLFGHAAGNSAFPRSLGFLTAYANFGVRIFFVISGFLITTLLLQEQAAHGRISLRKFYMRRVFRIFPASYALIAVVAVLAGAGIITLKHNDLLAAATYWMNFHREHAWWLGHLWSLSVEEQFYLIWPAILAFGGWTFGKRAAIIVVLLISPITRFAIVNGSPDGYWMVTTTFLAVADALACGCLLAGFRSRLESSATYRRVFNGWTCILLAISTILAAYMSPSRPRIDAYFLVSFMNIAITLCMHWCLMHKDSLVVRFFELRPIAFIGSLSYSLYLWQQLFLNHNADALIPNPFLGIVLSFVAAIASYWLIEKPFLKIKDRYFHS